MQLIHLLGIRCSAYPFLRISFGRLPKLLLLCLGSSGSPLVAELKVDGKSEAHNRVSVCGMNRGDLSTLVSIVSRCAPQW